MEITTGKISITVLGSGTSVGVPTIGCKCPVCQSEDPRDKRLRPSVLVRYGGHHVLIDTSPDFRQQVLRFGVERVDAILYTHAHADHILGLDDVRPFNYHQDGPIPIYASKKTLTTLQRVFAYIFDGRETQSSRPRIDTNTITGESFELFGLEFTPLRLHHGNGDSYGFRFGKAAYLTDHSLVPEESMAMLHGLDVLFLDALRRKPHPTHSTLEQSIETAGILKPKRAFFTHICHDLGHEATESKLPPNIRLAYDGMEVTVESA